MTEEDQPMEMRDLITHFRMKANDTFPYLAPFVYQLDPVERPGLGTMAVDKQARLYYDPDFVAKLTPEQGSYVVLHEATHLILRHCHRAESIVGLGSTAQERRRLNIAFDLVIWEFLEAIAGDAPMIGDGEPVTWHNMKPMYPKLERNMLPHEIYAIMRGQDEEQQQQAAENRKFEQEQKKKEEEQAKQQQEQEKDEEAFDPASDDDEPEHGDDWTEWNEDESDSADEDSDEEGDGKGGDDDGDAEEEDADASDQGDDGGSGTEPSAEDQEGDGSEGGSSGEGDKEGKGGFASDKFDLIGGGSAADGQPRDYEDAPNENWEAFQEDALLGQVEKKINEQKSKASWHNSRGTHALAEKLLCEIEHKLRPQPDPWKMLRAAVSKAMKANRGAREQTWAKVNRRQYAWGGAPRMQGEETYSPKACVVIDTSGSMTEECKIKCVNVVAQGLRAVGGFTVICGDVRVQSAVKLQSLAKLEIPQGGGTDMRPLIAHAEEKYRPDVLILCTDGGTPWPSAPTRAQLVIALTQELPTPEWATRCRIPDEGKK